MGLTSEKSGRQLINCLGASKEWKRNPETRSVVQLAEAQVSVPLGCMQSGHRGILAAPLRLDWDGPDLGHRTAKSDDLRLFL